MKQQKRFDRFKVVTTSMFVIGIGLSLLSLFFYVRLHWSDEFDFERVEERRETDEMPVRPTGPSDFKVPSSEFPNEQDAEKEEEAPALLDPLEEESPSNFDSEAGLERAVGASEEEENHSETEELDEETRQEKIAYWREEVQNRTAEYCRHYEEGCRLLASLDTETEETTEEIKSQRRTLEQRREELLSTAMSAVTKYLLYSQDFSGANSGGWIDQIWGHLVQVEMQPASAPGEPFGGHVFTPFGF